MTLSCSILIGTHQNIGLIFNFLLSLYHPSDQVLVSCQPVKSFAHLPEFEQLSQSEILQSVKGDSLLPLEALDNNHMLVLETLVKIVDLSLATALLALPSSQVAL